jgi:hypothetical protein
MEGTGADTPRSNKRSRSVLEEDEAETENSGALAGKLELALQLQHDLIDLYRCGNVLRR